MTAHLLGLSQAEEYLRGIRESKTGRYKSSRGLYDLECPHENLDSRAQTTESIYNREIKVCILVS